MTSQYESQTVEEIDFGALSDEQLADIADNDSRTTAQDKAKAEQNRRANPDESGTGASTTTGDPRISPSVQEQTQSADATQRQEDLGFNTDGLSLEPDAGQSAMQEAQDKIDAKGFIGGVPDPTPNENYAGVNSTPDNNLPTPETDAELFDEARKAALGHPLENVDRNSVETATSGGSQ